MFFLNCFAFLIVVIFVMFLRSDVICSLEPLYKSPSRSCLSLFLRQVHLEALKNNGALFVVPTNKNLLMLVQYWNKNHADLFFFFLACGLILHVWHEIFCRSTEETLLAATLQMQHVSENIAGALWYSRRQEVSREKNSRSEQKEW